MSFESFVAGLSFNLLAADVALGEDGRFHLRRSDGGVVTLLDYGPFALERQNTRLPLPSLQRDPAFGRLAGIPKMSTFTIGGIVNAAVSDMRRDCAFVNVGVWHGYTFLAGLHGNGDARAVAIDNFSEFQTLGNPRREFLRHLREVAGERQLFIERDYRDVLRDGFGESIGVYMYDGAHTYEDQLDGLRLAEPFFADGCIVIVDDANWAAPREATYDFIAQSSRDYSVLLDVSTAGNHPTLWNGLLVLREGRSRDAASVTDIPAPRFPGAGLPSRRLDETVAALIDVRPGEAAATATLRALESQSKADLELATFGPVEPVLPGVGHHASAAEALEASRCSYALLVEAGAEPPADAVEKASEISPRR